MGPGINNLIVTFVVGDETHIIVHRDLVDFIITALHDFHFFLRDDDVVKVERQTAFIGFAIAKILDAIEEFASTSHTYRLDDFGNDVAERFLGNYGIDKTAFHRNYLIDYHAADGGFDQLAERNAVFINVVDKHLDRGVNIDAFLVESYDSFLRTIECEAGAESSGTELGDIIKTEHHVL